MAFVEWLQGKKTYFLLGAAVLVGLVNFISNGVFTLDAFFALGKETWFVAVVAALRAGVTKSGK